MKGVMDELDLQLIEHAADAIGFATKRHTARDTQMVHILPEHRAARVWNPLDPRTGDHMDILLALPQIQVTCSQELAAVYAVIEGPDYYHLGKSDLTDYGICRAICQAAAQYSIYPTTRRKQHDHV